MKIHLSIPLRIFFTIVLALGMAGVPGHSAQAVTLPWIVTTLGGNFGTCDTSNRSCTTLLSAVSASSSGDKIAFDPALSGTIILANTISPAHGLTIHGSPKVILSGGSARRIFDLQNGVTLNLENLTIINGNAGSGDGGAINIYSGCTANVSGSSISGSTATRGGAIYNAGTLMVTDSLLQGNAAAAGSGSGGGIYNYYGILTISRSMFTENSSPDNAGGGIFVNYGSVLVTDSTFDSNSAGSNGGGMEIENAAATVDGSTFTGNTATWGAAINIYNTTVNEIYVTNSTFSANSAYGGGGIYFGGTVNLANSTFSENTASSDVGGGGADIFSDGRLNFTNTILANPVSGGDCVFESSYDGIIGTNINNLVEDGYCSDINSSNQVLVYLSGDPHLASLADNGGPTLTMALLTGSPAIDAGDYGFCPATDQRGITRPDPCDIGAYEYGTTLPGAFNKSAPSNAAVTVSTSPTLSWGASTDAAFYEYCYAAVTGCTDWKSVGTDISVPLNGLAYGQTYYWQARAVNAGGPAAANTGSYWSFTTGSPPSATTNSASGITTSGATLNGTVNAHSSSTTVTFEYGLTDTYGSTVAAVPGTVSSSSDTPVSAALTGLPLNTLYHFRVKAVNVFGTTYGADLTFTTGCIPNISVANNADNGAGSLRQAIQDVCEGGTISFDSGLSAGTISLTTARLQITRDMTIDGSALATPVTISGNNARDIFYIDQNVTATLKGLRLINGSAYNGAAIYIDQYSNLTVTDSTLQNNTASNYGGAIYAGQNSTLAVTNNALQNNSAPNGGAIYIDQFSNLTVTNSTLNNNTATYSGGAIAITEGSATVTNSTLQSNSAANGGGIYSYGDLSVTLSLLKQNSATEAGGGIQSWYGTLTVLDSTFDSNHTGAYGGGLLNGGPDATVTNTTLVGNSSSQSGGGIYVNIDSSLTLTNSTLAANSADLNGGAIGNDASLTVTNSTLAGNSSGPGANIYNTVGHSTLVINTIIGSSGIGSSCGGTGTINDGGHNLDSGNSCGFSAVGSLVNADPLLGALQDNGGPTRTMELQVGSPAIDAGNDAVCAATPVINGDQRGVARPQGLHCDIGAYELKTILYAIPGGLTTGICESWAHACELRYALTSSVSDQEIWATLGIYNPTSGPDRTATFQLKNRVALYGGFAGTETARSQRNLAANPTILSGDIGIAGNASDNSYHVVTGSIDATLDGFRITAGNANGTSSNHFGGGMYNVASAPTLTNITFSGNTALWDGGGMYNDSDSNPILTNVTFSGNTAGYFGGGIANNYSDPTLANVTFSANTAGWNGGGMENFYGDPALTNVTFSGNTATTGYGGGMENQYSSPKIRNTIFWGNTAATGGAQIYNNAGSSPVVRDSVVQGGYAGGINIITTDPLLGTLGNYGGYTQTIPLLAGSSAIDTGNDTICALAVGAPNYGAGGLDQRGVTRPQGAHCDIGAYEVALLTHSISLVSGWNLVSFNLHPLDTSIAAVLTSISGQYSLVYAWDAGTSAWRIYDPTLGALNDLNSLDESLGFWIKMDSDQTLIVSGTVPGSTSIALKIGWNLVGYPSAASATLPDVLSTHGVGTDFSLVYAYHASDGGAAWKLFDRAGNPLLNDLAALAPGWGYWVKADADHAWIVP